jgi:hypothetical protein
MHVLAIGIISGIVSGLMITCYVWVRDHGLRGKQ